MAVVYIKEVHRGRGGSEAIKGKYATVGQHNRAFLALTDSISDDETVILSHADCPKVGDIHPNDVDAYCRSVRATNQDFSKKVWTVEAEYSTDREINISPIADPVEITWDTENYQRPYFKDRNGYGITNSAGDPYDPPPEGDDSRWTVTVTKNVDVVPEWILTYRDSVNAAAFNLDGLAIPAGSAKIMSIKIGKWEKRSIFWYRTVSITMAIDSAGWQLSLLDAGFRKISGAGRVNITNSIDGENVTSPVPLNGSGGVLAAPTAATCIFRNFDIYPSKDFSVLPLS